MTTVGQCCSLLLASTALAPLVSLPGNGTYQNTLASYFSAEEGALQPACVFSPTETADVAAAVAILSNDTNCDFAVKSHGHAPSAGFANIAGGVTIDLTGMDSVEVSADASVMRVGMGASWVQVYAVGDAHGVQVAGGRNGGVGVGGLLLGGGISYFSPRVGWACDAVASFEVVLAGGRVAGGNNLGVVTTAELRAFPQGQIMAGTLAHNISDRDAVFAAVTELTTAKDYDEYASIVLSLNMDPTTLEWTISEVPAYTKPVLRPKSYEPLFAVPNITDTLAIVNLSTFSNESAIPQLEFVFYTGTYAACAETLPTIFEVANATLSAATQPAGMLLWSVAFEPLPTKYTQWGDRNGGNVLGTEPSQGNAFIVLMSATAASADANDAVESISQQLMANINAEMQRRGLLHAFQYANYADASQNVLPSYGAANVQRLKNASAKYDPKGVFQNQVPGGFKIKNVV
ncbi:FAD-binding protein [Mycena chlorophos]|uniref:FAD-binding protein n=1 Tax=Mycena chlorophos TaxID=658473 RepID=A0A8H6W964_MYCCL|nr:FAD-binding protein [Mycena chlorophos]